MNACKCQILDRHYSAPLLTPPLKFVMFFLSVWSSRMVFSEEEVFFIEGVSHTYTETQKRRNVKKKGKKVFAEENGLKGDPRLPTICQASELFLTSPNKVDGHNFLSYSNPVWKSPIEMSAKPMLSLPKKRFPSSPISSLFRFSRASSAAFCCSSPTLENAATTVEFILEIKVNFFFLYMFEADPFMRINGVEFVATSTTPMQDPTSPQLQNVSIDELFRAIEVSINVDLGAVYLQDLRRDVKELGELKKSMEELTKTSGNIERSLKVMEFKLYHNEDKNLPPKDSVSNVDFTQQSVDKNPMMTPVADPPLRKRLRCSPAQLDNDVTIDISDAEDDATISDKHESGLSRASQSSRLDSIKGKCIVNPQLRTKAKSTAFLASNYCRTLPTKVESSLTRGKLLTSPSPNMRVAKMTKTGDATLFSVPRRLPAQSAGVPCLQGERSLPQGSNSNQMEKSRYYNAMIKAFRCKFRPCAKMQLKSVQLEGLAYAFCASIEDPSETMINVDDTIVTREELACLAPGRPISDKIIKLVVMKATWDQANKTFWMLPPSFAVNIILLDGKLYQFDSNLNDDQVEPRQEIMKSLALKLSDMVTSGHYLKGDIPERKDFMNFDVKEVRGVPKCPQSRDSGLWVLQWLSMREKFNPTVSGILNEQYIRTSVVVDLLLGVFNDHKYEFQKKSNEFWATL
ncbi:hypothetical protein Ahy_B03g067114 [Arachis hypogaea]|uniref:Ubiquitin-like protease family profile domain-containing protein n=1 Tax=Arachis hypogaea TaxID=3818 RepID=A0A445A5U9_ARAHY|nr:hypothetical protein Ahy_B03g067114 [Arachis hypogaea]